MLIKALNLAPQTSCPEPTITWVHRLTTLMSLSNPLPRPIGITVLHEGTPSTVDIICVHGLNSTPEKCWKTEDVLWLRDLLPKALGLENTRIATFGFNSNVLEDASTGRIRDHAINLLQDLSDERKNEEAQNRPIIFICHSLGGIIVKQALVIANPGQANKSNRFEAIIKATYGIVFLGTPHRGSDLASLGKIMARIAKFAFQDPKTQLLKSLKANSQQLLDLSEEFSNLHSLFQIVSCYEQKKTVFKKGLLSKSMLVVPESSVKLGIEGEILVPMNTNHHDICKFSDADDAGYIRVRNRILELVEKSGESSRSTLQIPVLRIGESSPQAMDFIGKVASTTGVSLKTVYDLYQNCAALFRNIHNDAKHLRKCREKLSSQAVLFAHIFQSILHNLVDKNVAAAMLEDQDHSQWKNPTFQEVLNTTTSSFDNSLKVTRETLENIESKLSKRCTGVCLSVLPCSLLSDAEGAKDAVLSERETLLGLIQKLKIQNQELGCLQRQRHPVRESGARSRERNLKSPDSEVILTQLRNIREVAKIVYDGLAVTARCPCHRVNLQLQAQLNEPESEAGTDQTDQCLKSFSGSRSAIRFRLIMTKGTGTGDRGLGPDSETQCECTYITINSELQQTSPEAVTASRKRPGPTSTYIESGKKVRFAEGSKNYFETSSTRAILTVSDGGEPEARAKRSISINIGPGAKRVKLELEGEEYTSKSPSATINTSIIEKTIEYDTNAPSSQSTATANVSEIDNLCSLLTSTEPQTGGKVKGLLGSIPHNGHNPTYRHLMYREPLNPHSASRISLETILAHPLKQSLLTHLERLKIALTLSLSLLHFGSYSTSWFQERWRSRDIFFFLELQRLWDCGTALNPYVVPSFPASAKIMSTNEETPTPTTQTRGLARNEQLFSLALVLVGIGFGDTLFKIHEPSKIPGKRDDEYAEYMKVQKILESGMLAGHMGTVYAAVARRCFDCDFAIEFGEGGVDLSKGEIQEIFYRKVVCELERCLKCFQMS